MSKLGKLFCPHATYQHLSKRASVADSKGKEANSAGAYLVKNVVGSILKYNES